MNNFNKYVVGWLVGWEINVPFLHKNRLYQGQGLGWRYRGLLKLWKSKKYGHNIEYKVLT